jgi:hypothetical protein
VPDNRLKTINIVIGTILLTVGLLFVSANFISPHKVLTEDSNQGTPNTRSLGSIDNFHLNGYPPETLEQSPDNIYRSILAVNVTNGQALEVSWYADIFVGVFIFSQEQFAYFQSVVSKMQPADSVDASAWASANRVFYEAVGWARKNGEVSYTVSETGNYVAVITNAMYGAAYATIWDFNLNLISYDQTTNHTNQNDSLYLHLGIFFMIIGIAQVALALSTNLEQTRAPRKTTQQ